jgi:hypothetical protein
VIQVNQSKAGKRIVVVVGAASEVGAADALIETSDELQQWRAMGA